MLKRVLVIDDEELLGQTIQLGLEDSYEVELQTRGEAGLNRALSGDEFAVILCDLSLPDLSGAEIFANLSQRRPDLLERFVVMTGGAVNTQSRDFLDAYNGRILNKPFTLGAVESLVEEVVGH